MVNIGGHIHLDPDPSSGLVDRGLHSPADNLRIGTVMDNKISRILDRNRIKLIGAKWVTVDPEFQDKTCLAVQ